MAFGLIDTSTAFMDHLKRVSDSILRSYGSSYTWHVDILQGQRQIYYLFGIVSQTVGERRLYGNSKNCEFWLQQVVFLGLKVLRKGMKVNLKGENNFKVAKTNRYHQDYKVFEFN